MIAEIDSFAMCFLVLKKKKTLAYSKICVIVIIEQTSNAQTLCAVLTGCL
jgi:hypothetical protein